MRIERRCAALLGVLAGCYSPFTRDGSPCESSDQCPWSQHCVLGSCSARATPEIDASAPEPDAAIDAPPPIDAMRPACSTAGLACGGGTATMFACGGNCWVRCTANVTRNSAKTACTNWTGALGEIDDATEQGCVAMHITAPSWIGLIQSDTATTPAMGWTWNGATQVVYTNWSPGKPDDADNNESRDEQCADIRIDGTWDDDGCNQPLDFFCERP
jgi:hypothetical protein